jgi:hypothetical protein
MAQDDGEKQATATTIALPVVTRYTKV